jgi:DNA topoisomerase III
MALRSITDLAQALATGCLRTNQRSVRSGAKDSDVPKGVADCECNGCRGEGELIFRYIYEATESDKPVSRLWISSLTPDAIRKGFDKLRPGSEYERLADAASGRSRADWLVGMNLSRAYSIVYSEQLSVGRVQTPTLAMVVDRELTLRRFVSEDYIEVVATFQKRENPNKETYEGTWFRTQTESSQDKDAQANISRLPADGQEANSIILRARAGEAVIESLSSETQRMQPPLLCDLTELQRHANRLYGFSAQDTLDTAQALYERHKLISYPRTDSRHLSAGGVRRRTTRRITTTRSIIAPAPLVSRYLLLA